MYDKIHYKKKKNLMTLTRKYFPDTNVYILRDSFAYKHKVLIVIIGKINCNFAGTASDMNRGKVPIRVLMGSLADIHQGHLS